MCEIVGFLLKKIKQLEQEVEDKYEELAEVIYILEEKEDELKRIKSLVYNQGRVLFYKDTEISYLKGCVLKQRKEIEELAELADIFK